MATVSGVATGHLDLMHRLRRVAAGRAQPGTVTFAGTGNGTLSALDGGVGAPTETWTLTATSATAFSVTGSVSGARAGATVGTAYDNGVIAFLITAGATAFAVNDAFTVPVTASPLPAGERWLELRRLDEGGPTQEVLLRGPGLAGTDEIYVGLQALESVAGDYYNWYLLGAIGYDAGLAFLSQPGRNPNRIPRMALWTGVIPYWIVASGRRLVLVAKVSTVYQACYLGLMLPYATPGQYPYPLVVGGSMTGAAGERWSTSATEHRHFACPGANDSNTNASTALMLRALDGSWQPFSNFYMSSSEYRQPESAPRMTWPYCATHSGYVPTDAAALREAPDGSRVLSPVVLAQSLPTVALLGELDGVFHVSGFGLAAEDVITQGGVEHLVVQNVFRTGRADYWALKLA